MQRAELVKNIQRKASMLCVGLDTDIRRIPQFIIDNYDNPVYEFNRRIINQTKDHCVAYKFNIAFYESLGTAGWQALADSLALIPSDIFTIADAKRGDIGNTSQLYARTFFETFNFDSLTVSPYMGSDSLEPFYTYDDKWVIILGLTSNKGSLDFQMQDLSDGRKVYQQVITRCLDFGTADNTMFVVGATKPDYLQSIREIAPDHFFLMPGIGKQGGNLELSLKYGCNQDYGLLINSSRGIIYASDRVDFASAAEAEASQLNKSIAAHVEF